MARGRQIVRSASGLITCVASLALFAGFARQLRIADDWAGKSVARDHHWRV